MSKTRSQLTVLFADISGSTVMYEQLGDSAAQQIAADYLGLLTNIAAEFQGAVIKTIGDEVMCAFPTADLAVQAAVKMQEEVTWKGLANQAKVRIKVGFHSGDVIQAQDDLFGDAVNVAAHIAAQAKAFQVLTSKTTAAALAADWQAKTRFVDSTAFKGAGRQIELYEVLWGQADDLTITGGVMQQPHTRPAQLKLRYGDRLVQLDESHGCVTIGRGDHNDLVVPDTGVSRLHARIEYRRGRFILIEQSTNGSRVVTEEGKRVELHRDQIPLEGKGTITLAPRASTGAPSAIHFNCDT
jgi:class 3 adenylate cyclase